MCVVTAMSVQVTDKGLCMDFCVLRPGDKWKGEGDQCTGWGGDVFLIEQR